MKNRTSPRQRLQRELTADQLTVNPAFRAILTTIRHINADPRVETATPILARLNKVLPALDFADPISGPKRELLFNPKKRAWLLMAPLAWRSLEILVECANIGVLDRFRKCPMCIRWFFARTDKQEFCNRRCRQKNYASSPEGKKERREYMREYRAKKKEMEKRQAEASRQVWEADRKARDQKRNKGRTT